MHHCTRTHTHVDPQAEKAAAAEAARKAEEEEVRQYRRTLRFKVTTHPALYIACCTVPELRPDRLLQLVSKHERLLKGRPKAYAVDPSDLGILLTNTQVELAKMYARCTHKFATGCRSQVCAWSAAFYERKVISLMDASVRR